MNRPLRIGILEGDDIGLEVVPETVKVMSAAAQRTGLDIEWHPMPIGRRAYEELGYTLPPGTLEKLDTLDGWILGPIGHQAYRKELPNFINPHPILRKHFDLFANIRPSRSLPGVPAVTRNAFGNGVAWYVACDLDESGLGRTVENALSGAGVPVSRSEIELVRRKGDVSWLFAVNHSDTDAQIEASGVDVLSGTQVSGRLTVRAGDVVVLREEV